MKKEDKIKFQIEFTEVTKKQFDEIWDFLCNSGNKIKFQVIKSNDQYLNDEIEIIEEPKTNFNIGDRVKNIKNMSKLDYCNKYIGLKGTIINIDDSDNVEPYFVKFDNGEKEWFKHNELELVEEPKEELEEIELLRDGVHFLGVDLKVNEIIFKEKINELIANQNKIVRELKANKENE